MFLRPAYCCTCHARRRRNRLALTVLILVIAAAAWGEGHARPSGTRTAAPSHTRSPAARPEQAGPASAPSAAGQDLSWTDFHGIQLPVSASAGPRDTRGGLASRFADTPRGALLAAINIGVRTAAQWGPAVFGPTITRQVTGPDAAALLQAEESAYAQLRAAAHVRPGQPAGRGYAVEAAYRFAVWTPASAAVDVITAGPGSSGTAALASTRIELIWQRGDWRVLAPPGGDWGSSATAISTMTGYTIFHGER